jgi:hypothetical protein
VFPAADGRGEATEVDDVGCAAVRVEAPETTAGPAFRRRGLHPAEQLLGQVGDADLTGGIARRQPCLDAGPARVGQPLVSQEELTADPMERVALAAPVAQGLLLDSAADLVQGAVGQPDGVEVIDDQLGRAAVLRPAHGRGRRRGQG